MSHPSPVVSVIMNAAAGACRDCDKDELARLFQNAGMTVNVITASSGADLTAAVQRAAREAGHISGHASGHASAHASTNMPRLVVAAGGDGTLNTVASVLAGTDIALGVLPMGTLNHFAKDLNIPLGLQAAAAAIVAGHSIKIDVGEVNGRLFLNNSSLGLYPDMVRERKSQQRRLGRGKWMSVLWASITMLRRFPFLNVRLTIDNEEQVRRTPLVFIGNNEYVMEGFNIGRRARLDAGCLSLYVTHRPGRMRLFVLALRALFGLLRQAKDFDALTAQRILVETRHRQLRVATDGEVCMMETPLEYRVRPGALHVIVPAPQPGTDKNA